MLEELKRQVVLANQAIVQHGLVLSTFGNVSGIARDAGLVAIKPSGVPYAALRPDDIVVTDLDGKIVEGKLNPSSDLDTHLVLYRAFAEIGAIVHTHSEYATIWAQAGRAIPCYGTTHADYFYGPVPVTSMLSAEEVQDEYVRNTGEKIVRCFREQSLDPLAIPAVLVAGHAPFCWGSTLDDAVHHAVILEFVARMALHTEALAGPSSGIPQHLLDRHHRRKHGAQATYGQNNSEKR
ncbi:MAG TPA: L-ribulose-5-phosphate 4-epimerase AraD [Acidobacteriaceae bacterium]|nr:L-ribulose-5-phosphate 4-epimerase AraD [Acidobacteriaceae bacterium]